MYDSANLITPVQKTAKKKKKGKQKHSNRLAMIKNQPQKEVKKNKKSLSRSKNPKQLYCNHSS
jgi:hypothetical protein